MCATQHGSESASESYLQLRLEVFLKIYYIRDCRIHQQRVLGAWMVTFRDEIGHKLVPNGIRLNSKNTLNTIKYPKYHQKDKFGYIRIHLGYILARFTIHSGYISFK